MKYDIVCPLPHWPLNMSAHLKNLKYKDDGKGHSKKKPEKGVT